MRTNWHAPLTAEVDSLPSLGKADGWKEPVRQDSGQRRPASESTILTLVAKKA